MWCRIPRFLKILPSLSLLLLVGCAGHPRYSVFSVSPRVPGERYPLLFGWHYAAGDGPSYVALWKREAGRRKIIVLAPTRRGSAVGETMDLETFRKVLGEGVRRYPVNRRRIFVVGSSAGALSAKWALLRYRRLLAGAIFVTSADFRKLSEERDLANLPPVLFVHGEKDWLFPEIVKEVRKLRKRGVTATLIRYPNACHEHRPEWSRDIFDWMETV